MYSEKAGALNPDLGGTGGVPGVGLTARADTGIAEH